jgi:hypothetical protein
VLEALKVLEPLQVLQQPKMLEPREVLEPLEELAQPLKVRQPLTVLEVLKVFEPPQVLEPLKAIPLPAVMVMVRSKISSRISNPNELSSNPLAVLLVRLESWQQDELFRVPKGHVPSLSPPQDRLLHRVVKCLLPAKT